MSALEVMEGGRETRRRLYWIGCGVDGWLSRAAQPTSSISTVQSRHFLVLENR